MSLHCVRIATAFRRLCVPAPPGIRTGAGLVLLGLVALDFFVGALVVPAVSLLDEELGQHHFDCLHLFR